MTRRKPNAVEVARIAQQLINALGDEPANDDEPVVDEDAIREQARQDAEHMRRARRR